MRKAASHRNSYLKSALIMSAIAVMVVVSTQAAWASGVTIYAKALTSHDCNTSEWHFVITDIDSQAFVPAQIQVSWADGGSESVPKDKYTGKTAHYTTTGHLNSNVSSATTTIDSSWSGQFNLSHGPCGNTATPVASATASPTVSPTASPTATPVVTVNPTVSPSPSATATATATTVVTASPAATSTPGSVATASVSNGLSDNLGCSVHDCSGNVVPQGGVVLGVATELPSTGSFNMLPSAIALVVLAMGIVMNRAARYLEFK